jgi:hypothetical protein
MRPAHARSIGNAFVAITISRAMTIGTCCGSILLALAISVPARAQVTILFQESAVPGFSNNYPSFNDFPQYQGDQSFQWFIANHPDIAGALGTRSRTVVYGANWRLQVRALEQYLASHPYE